MKRNLNLRANMALWLIFVFLLNTVTPPGGITVFAQEFFLPQPGTMVHLSPEFNPPILKGLKVHPDNPFRFEFILDKGEAGIQNKQQLKAESARLIKYFLASLTVPENDLWVNLSPYEKDRIIPKAFGMTEMGRDLLAEDYMLKQITASLIYPENDTGRKFWKRVYEEAAKKFGTTNVPVNTFNKVWIVPEKAVIYENAAAGTVYVVDAKLKVMLEEDYLSLQKHQQNNAHTLASQIIREIVIPELTKEINEGRNFSQLRQVYNSLILAAWYKKKIKDSIIEQVYADKKKIQGLAAGIQVETIYQRYLQAFKKGVYNYIKEEQDPLTQQATPRKYFSGGMTFLGATQAMVTTRVVPTQPAGLMRVNADFAMLETGYGAQPTFATEQETESVYQSVKANMEKEQKKYLEKFVQGVNNSHPETDARFSPEFIGTPGEIKFLRILKGRLIKSKENGHDVYWILKSQKDPDSSKFEMLAYLLGTAAKADFTPIRNLTPEETSDLSSNGTPQQRDVLKSGAYLTRLVSYDNWHEHLLQNNREASFCHLFAVSLFLWKIDPNISNTGFVKENPVGLDSNHILRGGFEHKDLNDEDVYFYELLGNNILELARHIKSANEEYFRILRKRTLNDQISLTTVGDQIRQFGLGHGLIASEELNKEGIQEAMLDIKQINNIDEMVYKAGFSGVGAETIIRRLKRNQKQLGRLTDRYWQLLTGKTPGFQKLDNEIDFSQISDSIGQISNQAMIAGPQSKTMKAQDSLLAKPSQVEIASNPQEFKLGEVTIRDGKTIAVHMKERIIKDGPGMRYVATFGFAGEGQEPLFEDGNNIQMSLSSDDKTWTIDTVRPFSMSEGKKAKFGGTGAAQIIFRFLIQAVQLSGRDLEAQSLFDFPVFGLFLDFAAKREAWPVNVRLRSKDYKVDDILERFFDFDLTDEVYLRASGRELTYTKLRLEALGQNRYRIANVITEESTWRDPRLRNGQEIILTPDGSWWDQGHRLGKVVKTEKNIRFLAGWRQNQVMAGELNAITPIPLVQSWAQAFQMIQSAPYKNLDSIPSDGFIFRGVYGQVGLEDVLKTSSIRTNNFHNGGWWGDLFRAFFWATSGGRNHIPGILFQMPLETLQLHYNGLLRPGPVHIEDVAHAYLMMVDERGNGAIENNVRILEVRLPGMKALDKAMNSHSITMTSKFDISKVTKQYLLTSTSIASLAISPLGIVHEMRGPDGAEFFIKTMSDSDYMEQLFLMYVIAGRMGVHAPRVKFFWNFPLSRIGFMEGGYPLLVMQDAKEFMPRDSSSGLEGSLVFSYLNGNTDVDFKKKINYAKNGRDQYVFYDFDPVDKDLEDGPIFSHYYPVLDQLDADKLAQTVERAEKVDLTFPTKRPETLMTLETLKERQRIIRQLIVSDLQKAKDGVIDDRDVSPSGFSIEDFIEEMKPYKFFKGNAQQGIVLTKSIDEIKQLLAKHFNKADCDFMTSLIKQKMFIQHKYAAKLQELINRLKAGTTVPEALNVFSDSAMNSLSQNGGIDLTAGKTPLEVKVDSRFRGNDTIGGKGIRFHLDPALMARLKNAPGLVPVIIDIQPLTNLKAFLELADRPVQSSI